MHYALRFARATPDLDFMLAFPPFSFFLIVTAVPTGDAGPTPARIQVFEPSGVKRD
jgi:hypothetical protein